MTLRALPALAAALLVLAGCGSEDSGTAGSAPETSQITGDTPCPPAEGAEVRVTSFEQAPPMCIDESKSYTATLTTDVGEMEIELDAQAAPETVNNFVVLARYGYYDGVTFHRVIQGFMAQGGDPEGTGRGGPGYQFADELPKEGEYEIGSVAMANSGPDTNGSQFFIITGDAGVQLPASYSLFGSLTKGEDVLAEIEADGSAGEGAPTRVHTIESVTITEE